jgi:hypothetical protein
VVTTRGTKPACRKSVKLLARPGSRLFHQEKARLQNPDQLRTQLRCGLRLVRGRGRTIEVRGFRLSNPVGKKRIIRFASRFARAPPPPQSHLRRAAAFASTPNVPPEESPEKPHRGEG